MDILRFFCKTVFLFLILTVISLPVFSDEITDASYQLIDDYVDAVRINDPYQIKSAWGKLNNDQAARTYMRERMPELDYLFRVRGMYMELQEFQASRPELFRKAAAGNGFDQTVDTLREDLSVRAVENFSVSPEDRQRLRTNREIVMDSKGIPRVDNRTIALSNPNQNRIDNDVLINARTDRFYLSKFQEPPGQLVPRGPNFPKTRPPTEVDAIVQDVSSRLVLQNGSQNEQVLDIYVNGSLVGSQITVPPQGRKFEVYLTRGVNRLRVVSGPSEDASQFVGVSLQDASYVKDNGAWTVKPGQERQWLVEVKLES